MRFAKILLCGAVAVVMAQGAASQSGKKGAAGAVVEVPACGSADVSNGTYACSCPAGFSGGSVWGSGPYTADSNVCTAAQHAGVIGPGGGVVQLSAAPGQSSYTGSSANGVATSDWGSYDASFDVAAPGRAPAPAAGLAACGTLPDGVAEHNCACAPGVPARSVWGNGPYTADSDICTAAVHAGYIDAGEGGAVYVLRIQGLASYYGNDSNGVTSSEWGSYSDSIVFDWNR